MMITKRHYYAMLPSKSLKGRDAYAYPTEAQARAKIASDKRAGWRPWIRVEEHSYECDCIFGSWPHPEHEITTKRWVITDV